MTKSAAVLTFEPAEKLFKDAFASTNVQAFAEKSVAATQDLIAKSTAAVQDQHKAFTEIADTAWANSKLLNEKVSKNFTDSVQATMAAAQAMATAKSLPELGKIQADFVQTFAAQATEQMKDYFALSTRVSQHMFETTKTVAQKSIKSIA